MSVKTPIRTVFDGSNNATGLAEFQSGEFIGLTHGGLGASLSIGSAGQILKVNTGGTALEFGDVPVVDIDSATDLTGSTLIASDQILLSDGGTEGRVTLSQIDTLFTSTTQTLTNKTLTSAVLNTGVSGTAVLDEDNMASNSATQLATQQSIKAYVDTEIGNLSSTLTISDDSSTSDTVTVGTDTLNFAGGTGISSTVTDNTVTFAIDSTVVTESSTDTLTNKTIDAANNTLSNIGNSSLTNSSITVTDGSTSTATSLGGTITFSGTANEIEVGESSGTLTFGLPDNVTVGGALTVTGNLTVNGTTTTVNSTNTTLDDNLLELNSGAASNANDSGIIIERGSTGDNAIIAWDESADKFVVGTTTATASDTGDLTISTGTLVANVEGAVTGNASTATALETGRNIAGQSFDGTGDITIASTDLSDTASIVLLNSSQTLTNKTLTTPVISSISNTGTLTLPTSTDTLVGKATTDTLTNKTIDTANNTITIVEADISDLGSYITASSTDTLTNKTLTSPKIGTSILDTNGNELFNVTATASAVNEITYANAATGNGPTLTASGDDTNIDINITPKGSGQVVLDGLKYPSADGTADQILKTDGSGNLSFVDAGGGGGGISWQAVKTSAFTAVASEGYFVNTTSAAITVTLPASPTLGDEVTIVDYAGTADTNNITVGRNSENIQGSAADLTVSVERAAFTLVYTDGTQGWLLKDK